MKSENKQNVYVKDIQKNRVKRAGKQKAGIDLEKSKLIPVFLLFFFYNCPALKKQMAALERKTV